MTDAKDIAHELHLFSGHASAHRPKRISVDAKWANWRPLDCTDKVVAQC